MNLKFCAKCHNIYELTLKGDKPIYQCKVCGHTEEEDKGFFCIHSNQVGSNFKCYKSLKNKYTIYDPTLPRLNNIPCVNENCFTNQENRLLVWKWNDALKSQLFKDGEPEPNIHPLQMSDITSNYLDDVCLELITDQKHESLQKIIEDMKKGCEASSIPRILTFKDSTSYQEALQKLQENPTLKDTFGISPIQREVVFLKYDNANLKYLYMCCTCGASWTNMS